MTLLEEIRVRLRIKSTTFDEAELNPLINACKGDLERVGIAVQDDNPLIRQSIVLYCKANFGFSEDAERFQRSYEALRDSIALSEGG